MKMTNKKYLVLMLVLMMMVAAPVGAATNVAGANLGLLSFSAQISALFSKLSDWLKTQPLNNLGSPNLNSVKAVKNLPPVVLKVNQPTKDATLQVGKLGVWQIFASDPEGGRLDYKVTWGDEAAAVSDSPLTISNVALIKGPLAEFRHIYTKPGLYKPFFTISDPAGEQIGVEFTVSVTI